MPILSAVANTTYPDDTRFRSITTLNGVEVPDYGMTLGVLPGYLGDRFAFDSCTDPSLLVTKNAVAEDFLYCRYERLYKLDSTTPLYYLVPWLGVPYEKDSSNNWQLLTHSFTLLVRTYRIGIVVQNSPASAKNKKLRLIPSNANTTAVWVSQANSAKPSELVVPDITKFSLESIRIDMADAGHTENGESIEIREVLLDQSLGKTVGKVRLLFLEMLTQKVFLINVTDDGTNFVFDRILQASGAPLALDSGGGATHANVVQDTNEFGLRQIGISLAVEGVGIDPCEDVGPNEPTIFFDADDFPKSLKIPKSTIVGSANTVSTDADFEKFLMTFFAKVKYIRDSAGAKLSKYSRMYAFFTPFSFPGNPGVHQGFRGWDSDTAHTKSSFKHSSTIPPNISFFRWTPLVPAGTSQLRTRTFTHESSHAFFVSHYFAAESTTGNPPVFNRDVNLLEANTWLHLYLRDAYVKNMNSTFDQNKIGIEDFKTTTTRTLFDDINDQGMEPALKSFIDTKIFHNFPRPAQWEDVNLKKSKDEQPISDLILWRSLNNLVKFVLYKTNNIMDYPAKPVMILTSTNNTLYIQREPVYFTRFQWELARKAVRRFNDLTFEE